MFFSFINAFPLYASLKRLFIKTTIIRELQKTHMMQQNRLRCEPSQWQQQLRLQQSQVRFRFFFALQEVTYCLLLQINTVSSQKYFLSSGKQASPSRIICNHEKYFDSYDVTIPLQHGQCGLWLQTHALPYVEDYYVIFEDYDRDDNGNSLLADRDIMMNFGDVLLAVDGVDIEGKKLGDIMNMLKGKLTNIVTLTFLNKEWFNNYDRDSVKAGSAIQKKR